MTWFRIRVPQVQCRTHQRQARRNHVERQSIDTRIYMWQLAQIIFGVLYYTTPPSVISLDMSAWFEKFCGSSVLFSSACKVHSVVRINFVRATSEQNSIICALCILKHNKLFMEPCYTWISVNNIVWRFWNLANYKYTCFMVLKYKPGLQNKHFSL